MSFEWIDGKVSELEVVIGYSGRLKAIINDEEVTFEGKEGEIVHLQKTV